MNCMALHAVLKRHEEINNEETWCSYYASVNAQ